MPSLAAELACPMDIGLRSNSPRCVPTYFLAYVDYLIRVVSENIVVAFVKDISEIVAF